ncbi:ribonuclease H-like domain-containing protein [Mycena sp. CBHHK59/15]|nr:ribonuclease H-like domain-containing protein [Mycena sp. CBHHK59/15]
MSTTPVLVDTIPLLRLCLSEIGDAKSLAVDLEGVALCRSGKLCIIQLKATGGDTIWLIDVVVLGAAAFEESDAHGHSLKAILESSSIRKVFYDVRNDSDALLNLFGITLENVFDLQLLELAVCSSNPIGRRPIPPRFLNGLKASLEIYVAPLKSAEVIRTWARVKEAGLQLFAPERGGRYEVFEDRPLKAALVAYCAQDVALLDKLETALRNRMGTYGTDWERRIRAESAARVALARSANYTPRGREKALAPTIW